MDLCRRPMILSIARLPWMVEQLTRIPLRPLGAHPEAISTGEIRLKMGQFTFKKLKGMGIF